MRGGRKTQNQAYNKLSAILTPNRCQEPPKHREEIMKTFEPRGIFPAIPVSFNEDYSINEADFRRYLNWIADQGVDGLVCNGHTGEVNSLTREERARVIEICVDEVGDRLPIITGISAEGSLEAAEHARDAEKAGAKGILLMPPHQWLRFGFKPETPVRYFKQVADAVDISIIVHLYPSWTKAFYPVETRLAMAEIPNVIAIKDGTREMARYQSDVYKLREERPDIAILTCHDEYLLLSMIVGVDGALVGFGSLVPELITGLWKAVQADDLKAARGFEERIFPLKKAVYGMGEPSGDAHARLKEALVQRGVLQSAIARPPVPDLSKEEKGAIARALSAAGVEVQAAVAAD